MRPLLFVACAAMFWSAVPDARAEVLDGTLAKISERRAITLGHRDASIPFAYLDGEQKPVGLAMDLCFAIADAVKKRLHDETIKVNLLPVAPASRIALLTNGTIDLDCGANTNNVERQKVLAFTNTMFLTATRYVSKKSKNLHTIDDLKGRAVVSTSGTTNIKQLVEANAKRKLGLTILSAKDHAEGFLLVENGRADAFVMDDILLAGFVAASKDPVAFEISTEALSKPEPYAIMLRKDDPAFKSLVDETTAAIFSGPQMVALYDRWFTKPIPPRGINLNFPLSDQLRRSFSRPSDSADPDAY